MAYNDSPDRRPLLYGFAALLILVAAGFLFWPRGSRSDQPGLVLTPNTEESQLASQIESPSGEAEQGQDAALANPESEIPPEEIESLTITETEYAVKTDRARTSSPGQGASTQSTGSSSSSGVTSGRVTQSNSGTSAPRATDLNRPGPSGPYLLYLGSFSSRENAQRRATELQSKGIPAEISQGSKPDGSAIYRVRVGYFEGHSRAKAYGEELKSRHKLDYWIAER